MKKNKQFNKKTLLVTIGLLLGVSASVMAATWQGTDWISDGSIISATKMKENFQYLYDKVTGNATNIDKNTININKNTTAIANINNSQNSQGKFKDGANANDAVYTQGNVGIGTTTPAHKLHVAGVMQANRIYDDNNDYYIDANYYSILKNLDLTDYLKVAGEATFNNTAIFNGYVGAKKDFVVDGKTTLQGQVDINSNVNVGGNWVKNAKLKHNDCYWTGKIGHVEAEGECKDGYYVVGIHIHRSQSSGGWDKLKCCRL